MPTRILGHWKQVLRTACQTRSLYAARCLHTPRVSRAEIRLPGFAGTFRFRTGTSDAHFLRELLAHHLPHEYELPADFHPTVILDIGANIGAVSAALLRAFPAAQLYAFEPLRENAELLQHNLAQFPRATACPYGLGNRTEQRAYVRSDNPSNLGGGGFCEPALGTDVLPVKAVTEALAEHDIKRVDLIKIDVEGSEAEVLSSFPPDLLASVPVIVGELHTRGGDETLALLAPNFELEITPGPPGIRWFRARRRSERPLSTSSAATAAQRVPQHTP